MNKIIVFISFFCLISLQPTTAQVKASATYEVIGRPSWEMLIPLPGNELLLLTKVDVTKAEMVKFDTDLKQLWKTEFFIDAERQPVAYTVSPDKVSLMFSESNGMYYQLIESSLADGKLNYYGYELREYFVDQDYVLLNDKVLMAGKNDKGGAFYKNVLEGFDGKLINGVVAGDDVNVNHFELKKDRNVIESLWSVKINGYSDPARKRGAFIKTTKMVYAEFDTTGKVLKTIEVNPQGSNFPVYGQLITMPNGSKGIAGIYQVVGGDKGVYYVSLDTPNNPRFYSYRELLRKGTPITDRDYQALLTAYELLPLRAVASTEGIQFGGVFYKPEFRTFTTYPNQNNPYGNRQFDMYGNRVWNNQRGQTQQVFNGYSYPLGFTISFDSRGEIIQNERIDLNHMSPQIQQTLAVNEAGIMAHCLNGTVAVKNNAISSKPIIYSLSTDAPRPAQQPGQPAAYTASYNQISHWYGNTFIAKGGRFKVEAQTVQNEELPAARRGLFGRKQAPQPVTETTIRKTIYLTKISSGEHE